MLAGIAAKLDLMLPPHLLRNMFFKVVVRTLQLAGPGVTAMFWNPQGQFIRNQPNVLLGLRV